MSAKWRSLQHRHRYTYSAIVFPQYYKQTLDDFIKLSASEDHDASARVFYSQLNELVSLNSTYAQLSHAKKIAFAFTELLKNSNEVVVSQASRFYLEILFLENSVPLHRTLVSVLAKTRDFQSVISDCFRSLCEEYADVNGNGNGKRKRFCVSRVGLSMMSSPKLGYLVEVVEECAILMSLDVVSSLNGVVLETNELSRPSPIVMEQCQEALSCIYYLLQRCPSKFTSLIGLQDSNIIENIITTILSILKSEAFSRDCFVAAGVSFCAALQVCLCPEELGLAIIEGIFHHALTSSTTFQSIFMKIPYKGDLFSEIHSFSLLSRLCLIRGILTSVPRTLLDTPFVSEDTEMSAETILYNGILPELCKYCENPTDSHFNFHALTVMQICLQQIKTLLQTSQGDNSHNTKNHDPVSDDIGARILRIIWNNLEDPLSQTVKQVHLIFDIYIDIQSTLPSTDGKARVQLFLKKITSNLLRMGSRCKGRYVPLSSLTKRLGAKAILEMCPDMMLETAWAYIDDDVCCAATTFLKCFLESLRDEFWSSDGVEIGYKNYRNVCLPPFLQGLASGNSKLRSNLNTYAFPVILEVDVDSIFPMLAFISVGPIEEHNNISLSSSPDMNLTVEQKVAVLVSLLKVSRSLALIEGDIDRENTDYALVCVKGVKVKVLINWLVLALTHVDEFLRTDAVESLFLNPKTASLPSSLELSMMKEAMPLNMRCSSTSFQMKLTSLFRKFFSRVKTALERQIRQGTWKPNTSNGLCKETEDGNFKRADELFQFMKWLSSFLFFSCYPSAPYERKIMAMELILIMNNTWPIVQDTSSNNNETELITPYDARFISSESTLLLVGSIVDSWDRLRENSFRILLNFPTPLPGMLTTDMVKVVIIWAKNLVYSPRVRESDAGALTMRLIFRKYVLDLGWIVKASTNSVSCCSESSDHKPVVEYVVSLVDWLQAAVEMGEKDLSDACRTSFVHGVLLTLRYSFEELDWSSDLVMSNVNGMRYALEKLLELVMRITSMALSVVSADAWHIPDDMDDLVDDMWQPTADVDVGPSDQVVMVGCWLAMKEVSLLLGTIIRKIPLPTSDISNHSNDVMLDFNQLETIGNHFLEVLMKMKHNGAIDKTRAGFTALCNRLLCSDNPRLSKLPEQWMEQLMERTVAKGQTVDDLLRRSAGIPAAFIAFFLSEPEGTPKRLLPRALQWLINLSNKSVTAFDTYAKPVSKADPKVRDEGVIPTVHAFNVLKAAFNDTNLATDTSGFSAEAMIIAIRSFSSVYWEVRNSACLAYTALVRRMVGFLNVQKRESARRALTGLEFFHRYPLLHPFLYSELKIATDSSHDLANAVHPSLCPMLILLSRLKPSTIATESGDELDPFLLTPFIRKCSTQTNLRVRVLASRALTALISNEKLPTVLTTIATELPSGTNLASSKSNTVHGLLLQLISLLDVNCRNLVDFSKKDQILGDLMKIVVTRELIVSPCPTLVTSYLRVLDVMLSIAKTCGEGKSFDAVRGFLSGLSSRSLDAEGSFGVVYFDPTISECRKQAAVSYFNSVTGNESDVQERLVRLFSDKSYEVRLATFKWLLQFLNSPESNSDSNRTLIKWMDLCLHTEMVNLLSLERNHRCVCYILKILFAWNQKSSVGITDSGLFWEKLVSLYKTTRHMKTRESLLCCMAVCVKQFSHMFIINSNHKLYDSIAYYVDLVKLHSNASETVNIRKAVSESIIASGLLQTVESIGQHVDRNKSRLTNMYASRTLEVWSTCIKLLEDEDVSLRSKLAIDVQKCFTSDTYGIPSQVDKVIKSSFDYLTLVFGQWVDYFDYLCEWVLSVSDNVVSRGDLVRRVFDKEIDNHHEEKLLVCQICCFHLEKVNGGLDLLCDWRRRFLRRLVAVSGDRGGGKQAVEWIGGLGNHKDAFLAVYSNLLGVYAMSRCILKSRLKNSDSDSGLMLEMAEVGDVIKPFLGNPLINNLFLTVVGLHEEPFGQLCDSLTGDEALWDRFDPYFLLR
ncbi:hypothetical protein LXL04_024070 [Taraxacum kok-saghyz]